MKKILLAATILTLTITVSKAQVASPPVTDAIPAGYYNSAAGLTCGPLKTALFNIISSNTTPLTYNPGTWNAFPTTDVHRNDANTATVIWDIYTDNPTGPETYTFDPLTSRCGSYSGVGDCYNREHSFPQAWFGNGVYPMFSDLHHIFPTDGFSNGKHDNNPYSEVGGTPTFTSPNGCKLGTNSFPGFTGIVYEPIDAYKGDIARAQLYMVTRYEDSMISWRNNSNANDILNGTKYPSLDDWYIKLLYKWHLQDPVSAKEIARNDAIYALQHNRNPFVDHPEYVALIWQCTGLLPVKLTDFTATKNSATTITLNWHATFESNFKSYEVERSTDGIHFTTIGTVRGQNSPAYNLVDRSLPNATTVFYRLKMIDIDNRFTQSDIVSVKLDKSAGISVFPNPGAGAVIIGLDKPLPGSSYLQVFDVAGRNLLERKLTTGTTTIPVDTHKFASGKYFVTIKNDNEVITTSFLIAQ